MIRREHNRTLVPTRQQHGAGIGVIHALIPPVHLRRNRDGRGVFHVHLSYEFFKKRERSRTVFQNVRRLRYGCTCDDKGAVGASNQSRGPFMMRVGRIAPTSPKAPHQVL